jgi:hypothetical protein
MPKLPAVILLLTATLALSGCVTVVVPQQAADGPEQVLVEPAPEVEPEFDPSISRAACQNATRTTTQEDGAPGVNYYTLLQCFAWYRGGYEGPIDGYPTDDAWAGIQTAAASDVGYTGPIDGSLANGNAVRALQLLAASVGYTGPIDGDPGANTYKFSAALFNSYLESGW